MQINIRQLRERERARAELVGKINMVLEKVTYSWLKVSTTNHRLPQRESKTFPY